MDTVLAVVFMASVVMLKKLRTKCLIGVLCVFPHQIFGQVYVVVLYIAVNRRKTWVVHGLLPKFMKRM